MKKDGPMEGKTLRKKMLKERSLLTEQHVTEKSREIEARLLFLEEIVCCHSIMVYVDYNNEVMTLSLIDHLLQENKKVLVPLTLRDKKQLLPVQIQHPEQDLHPGYCGIPEPRPLLCEQQQVSPRAIDIVLVPGSVFDVHGGRFGYGGGFYDRFLANDAAQATRIGLAFDFQVQEHIPLESHDELLDIIVTEKRVIYGDRYKKKIEM